MTTTPRERCAQPDAPWVRCWCCNKPLKTCERKHPKGYSYLCPEHPDGVQKTSGIWLCLDCDMNQHGWTMIQDEQP